MKQGASSVTRTSTDAQRDRAAARPLRALLVGGDRRSIARSNEALAVLRADEARVVELVRLLDDNDWLVVMRAMDLAEKLAHEHPEWIQAHRSVFIGPLAQHPSWEIRLQIARALPLLRWSSSERQRVIAILLGYVKHPQKFVKAWALDSLSRLAGQEASLMAVVEGLIRDFEHSESPALLSRARQIRRRLQASAKGPQRPVR
jgi:HEAT repeat protein